MKKRRVQGSKSGAREARNSERRVRAIGLREAGLSYRQIAANGREKGWSPKTYGEAQAYRDVRYELDRRAAEASESAGNVLTLELARLDRLQVALESKIRDGDTQAINTAIRLSESRRRLLGVDAPEKQEVEHKGGVVIHVPDQFETVEAWEAASNGE